jgi:hypothetical protein
MNRSDAIEAAARHRAAAYHMGIARARFKVEPNPNRKSFREWARATYTAPACTGKLAGIVETGAA